MKTIKAKISNKVGHWQHPDTGKVFLPGDIVEIPEKLFHPDAMERVTPTKKKAVKETAVTPGKEDQKTEEPEVIVGPAEDKTLFKGIDAAKDEEKSKTDLKKEKRTRK